MKRSPDILQRGISLIEILIGVAIGAVIVLLIAQIFQSQHQNYRTQQALSRLQENARFAMEFLARDIRMAGRANTSLGLPVSIEPFFSNMSTGYDNAVHNNFRTRDGSEPGGGASQAFDQIVVQYYQPDDNLNQDCLGNVLPDNVPIRNRYYIAPEDDDGDGIEENYSLFCDGNFEDATAANLGLGTASSTTFLSDNPQPLVRGVDKLQIQYGVDQNNDDYADLYVNATSLNNATYSWNNVVSVRVGLIVNSQQSITDTPQGSGNLQLLDAPTFSTNNATQFPPAKNINFLRRAFTTTIMLRNRAP